MNEPNLSKDTQIFLKNLQKKDIEPLYKMTPENARTFLNKLQEETHKNINADVYDTSVFTVLAGNVALRIVRPYRNTKKLPVILYIHGGGWILGNKETHDMLIRKLANCSNCVVIFPEYTPSPKAQYPEAINQIYAVLDYIYNSPDEFNIDSDKIILAGDSVGGNMSIAVALRAKNEDGPKINFQLLFYPVTDAAMNKPSYKEFENGPWLTKKAMEWFWDTYLPDKKQRNDIYASPLKATKKDLKGLPPTIIITDENDILRDEGEAFAIKLSKSGVDATCVRINGTIHDFLMLNALEKSEETQYALKVACDAIRQFSS